MNASLYSPLEMSRLIGRRAKERRLTQGRTQADLAQSAGVSLSTVHRFESGRDVGMDAVVRIALTLGSENEMAALFPPAERRTLDEILAQNHTRQRARARRPR